MGGMASPAGDAWRGVLTVNHASGPAGNLHAARRSGRPGNGELTDVSSTRSMAAAMVRAHSGQRPTPTPRSLMQTARRGQRGAWAVSDIEGIKRSRIRHLALRHLWSSVAILLSWRTSAEPAMGSAPPRLARRARPFEPAEPDLANYVCIRTRIVLCRALHAVERGALPTLGLRAAPARPRLWLRAGEYQRAVVARIAAGVEVPKTLTKSPQSLCGVLFYSTIFDSVPSYGCATSVRETFSDRSQSTAPTERSKTKAHVTIHTTLSTIQEQASDSSYVQLQKVDTRRGLCPS